MDKAVNLDGLRLALARVRAEIDKVRRPAYDADGTPLHYSDNLLTAAFLDAIPPDGYAKNDYSVIWPILRGNEVDSGKAELNLPFCAYGKGDKMIVECDDEPAQEITPYKECFAVYCLTPCKTYRWRILKGTAVEKSGTFRVVGRVKWLKTSQTKYPHNFRDLGAPPELTNTGRGIKYGRIMRGEHPDNIEAGSADHLYIRDHLGVSVQLNLRDASKDPARADLFEKTYSYNIAAYAEALSNNTTYKTRMKNAFLALVKELEAGRNVYVNCWQGRDRTGTFCWIVQALCGMKQGYCEAHWELSSFDRCENSKIWNWEEATNGELRTFIYKLVALYGEDPYTQAYRFMTEKIGVAKERIEKLIEIMTL